MVVLFLWKKGDKVIYQWKRQLNQCEQLTNGTWYPVRCTFWFGGCHPPTNNKKTLGENVCTTFESYDVSSPSLLGVCTTTYNKSVVRIKWLMVSDQFWVLFSTNRSNSSCCRSSRAIVVFSISHFFSGDSFVMGWCKQGLKPRGGWGGKATTVDDSKLPRFNPVWFY